MVRVIETIGGRGLRGGDGVASPERPDTATRPRAAEEISIGPAGPVFWLKPDCLGDREEFE